MSFLMRLFILLVIILAFALNIVTGARADYGPYNVAAPVSIDGDTLRGDVLIWPDITANVAMRIAGIDAPEIKAATTCEREMAIKAKAFVDTWLENNYPVTISKIKHDKFAGRVNAHVIGKTGSLAAALLAAGHARPYSGGARQPWCN